VAFLIVEEGGQVRHLPLRPPYISVGRAPDNDVILTDDKSSRHHCRIETGGNDVVVVDLESLNGSYIGGLRIREHPLNLGDTLTIGDARLTLESEESTAFDTQRGPVSDSSESALKQADPRSSSSDTGRQSKSRADSREPAPAKTAQASAQTDSQATRIQRVEDLAADQALSALECFDVSATAVTSDKPERLAEGLCRFLARLIPGVRVAFAHRLVGEHYKAVAYANFVTRAPQHELPPEFKTLCQTCAEGGEAVETSTEKHPSALLIPVPGGYDEIGILYFELERRKEHFDATTRRFCMAALPLARTLFSARASVTRAINLRKDVADLKEQLEGTKHELQLRFDAQTAELSRFRDESTIKPQNSFRYDYSEIIGKSAKMIEVFRLLDKVTDISVPVLVIGEAGSGKELVARALHFNSSRALKGKFVAENCAALPEALLESELFGYSKGAFTGAEKDKKGLFELADGGTIFLDEIGEMTPSLQAKLLRVLQEGEIRPVGSNETKKVNFRLIAATNRPLEEMVEQGTFRNDLFYRINVITIKVPALRERKDDIPLLVDQFLRDITEERGITKPRASSGVLSAMLEYNWPGNVRELENEVKRMVALSEGDKIQVDLLSPALRGHAMHEIDDAETLSLKELVEKVEMQRIQEVLERTEGNKSKASEILGLSRLGLRKKMERYGVES